MIWTLISFAITFFVLKRYAFGPIQKLIDDRRERIRESVEEADRARDEARSLLEEHKALIGQARSDAEGILAEARRIADAQQQRMREETEEDRKRRLEETERQIEQATTQALVQIRSRGRRPGRARRREDHPRCAHRRGPEAADRRGARRDRLQRSWRRAAHSRRATHLCPRALRGRAGQGPARRSSGQQLGELANAIATVPELEAVLVRPGDRGAT